MFLCAVVSGLLPLWDPDQEVGKDNALAGRQGISRSGSFNRMITRVLPLYIRSGSTPGFSNWASLRWLRNGETWTYYHNARPLMHRQSKTCSRGRRRATHSAGQGRQNSDMRRSRMLLWMHTVTGFTWLDYLHSSFKRSSHDHPTL